MSFVNVVSAVGEFRNAPKKILCFFFTLQLEKQMIGFFLFKSLNGSRIYSINKNEILSIKNSYNHIFLRNYKMYCGKWESYDTYNVNTHNKYKMVIVFKSNIINM